MRSVARMRRSSVSAGLPVRTPGGLLRGAGRVVLWVVVLLLLVRGAAGVLARDEPGPAASARPAVAASWPDDEARAFAADFARAYLSYSPRHPQRYVRQLRRFVSPAAASSILPRFAQRESRQAVQSATVARTARVDGGRALVTVAATIEAGGVSTEYLTVPVARDARGGLTVYDLPSFSAPPATGSAEALEFEPLASAERAGIEDVVTRFFRAFLAGRADELEYLVPAGTRVQALGRPYELVGLDAVEQLGPARGRWRSVVATVRARDVQTRAVYPLRYRLALVRSDRWYVATVNTTPREG